MKRYTVVLESRAVEDLESRYRYLALTASVEVAEAWLDEVTDVNVGLEAAVRLAPASLWREALERSEAPG